MKNKKEEIEKAILFFADLYGRKSPYEALIATHATLPELTKMIIYEMFCNEFNFYHCSDVEYENYNLLLEYSKELNNIGYVEFI